MKFLIVTLVMSLSAAIAQADDSDFTDPQIDTAAKLLADDFRPYVIELDRDIQVYHYFDNPKITQDLPLHSPQFDHELLSGLNYFWSSEFLQPVYAAADPYISRDYGKMLLEITIKKGARILVGHHIIKLSPETIAAIGRSAEYFRFDTEIGNIPLPILAKALTSLEVEVATYEWGGDGSIACHEERGTFLLLGTPVDLTKAAEGAGVITKSMSVVGFTSFATDFSDPEKRQAYARINRFLTASHRNTLDGKPASKLSYLISPVPRAERARWRDEIYSCDDVHPSDEPPQWRGKSK